MQLSYNVIKSGAVIANGNKEIVTEFDNNRNKQKIQESTSEKTNMGDDDAVRAQSMPIIEEAKRQSEAIIAEARELAERIKQEAYEAGYDSGRQQGYNDAYSETLPVMQAEGAGIVESANRLLLNAREEYENYVDEKKDEIIKLSINIAETILKRELSSPDGFNLLLSELLNKSKNAEAFIIKASPLHVEEIKAKVDYWKISLGLKGEIFVVEDSSLDDYNTVIEKNNGRIEVGIKAGIEAIKEALL